MSRSDGTIEHLAIGTHQQFLEDGTEVHQFSVQVPSGLRWFEGHFEDNPVLPAMVQLREVAGLIPEMWPDLSVLSRIVGAKFHRRIRPDDSLSLRLSRLPGTAKASFEFCRHDGVCSSGTLEFSFGRQAIAKASSAE